VAEVKEELTRDWCDSGLVNLYTSAIETEKSFFLPLSAVGRLSMVGVVGSSQRSTALLN
jgi:hypothetical protein